MKKIQILLLIILFTLLLNGTIPVSAQQSPLISVSPINGTIKLNEERIVEVQLNSDSKISGFDLRFNSSDSVVITDFVDQLVIKPGFDPLNSKKVVENSNNSQTRISYIFPTAAANLPSNIKVYLKIKGTKKGAGILNIDSNNSQVLDADGKPIRINPISMSYDVSDNSTSGFY